MPMLMGMKAGGLRQTHQDSRGRTWSVVVVPASQAHTEDAAFWRTLTPEQRVVAVHGCLESALKAQGKTVLLCSHLLADVQDVCDRITILFRGRMQTLGQVKDLLQVKDVTQIEARGLTPAQIEETRLFMSRMGAGNAQITHPTTTLEELFVRVVQTNTPGNGKP